MSRVLIYDHLCSLGIEHTSLTHVFTFTRGPSQTIRTFCTNRIVLVHFINIRAGPAISERRQLPNDFYQTRGLPLFETSGRYNKRRLPFTMQCIDCCCCLRRGGGVFGNFMTGVCRANLEDTHIHIKARPENHRSIYIHVPNLQSHCLSPFV